MLLKCENVGYKYDVRHGIGGVSFDIESGDYLCIVGENGSGKSTLMKCLLGLLKPEGTVEYNGISETEIGYLPQQTETQKDFPVNVLEVVMSGCLSSHRALPFFNREDKKRAADNLKQLGIEDLKRKSYQELSGGQRQRVLLARALCAAKKLILLDEPSTGLDPVAAGDMYELLYKLNKDLGVTVAVISHDIQNSVKYGNKILHLDSKPLFFGKTEDYMFTEIYKKMAGQGQGYD